MNPLKTVAVSRNINVDHEQSLKPLERLALGITERVGSMGFFLTIFTWTVLWLGWNFLAPASLKFDTPMGFAFWLFISNMIQIFLMPLIMVGQNLQSRHAELLAKNDFEVNLKAERNIEQLAWVVEEQTRLITALLHHNGLTLEDAHKLAQTPPPPKQS